MLFPFALSAKIAAHILKHKLRRTRRFAMVLQLEPLHTCNLTCTGCGRIREYSTSLKDMVPLERCLAAAAECDAPMVSVCGGEPLIYPQIEELVAGLLRQNRIVYICTNGLLMRKKLRDYLAATPAPARVLRLQQLRDEQLLSAKEADAIRQGKPDGRPVIAPTKWLYWNVHIDGLEHTHDLIVEREGVFQECVAAIKMAKSLGFQVATNTTVYKETDVQELDDMFRFFSWLGADGHTISPGYDYDAAKRDMAKRLGRKPEDFFLTRAMTRQKFARLPDWGERFAIFGTAVYQEFLAGRRDLTCTAWAIPTFNIKGWKAPCYLMTDGHYPSYREMLERVDWDKYGVVEGVVRDSRCENCMVHCGYDPSGALGTNYQRGDHWKNLRYNFRLRPPRDPSGAQVQAFNGASVGRGHGARAAAVINSTPPGGNNGNGPCHVGTFCGQGEPTEVRAPDHGLAAAAAQRPAGRGLPQPVPSDLQAP
jgi:MoaA/NifB/PqqE/SkfB family radical SAM enzyme